MRPPPHNLLRISHYEVHHVCVIGMRYVDPNGLLAVEATKQSKANNSVAISNDEETDTDGEDCPSDIPKCIVIITPLPDEESDKDFDSSSKSAEQRTIDFIYDLNMFSASSLFDLLAITPLDNVDTFILDSRIASFGKLSGTVLGAVGTVQAMASADASTTENFIQSSADIAADWIGYLGVLGKTFSTSYSMTRSIDKASGGAISDWGLEVIEANVEFWSFNWWDDL